ncbi:hypothetical protein AB0F07_25965 [Streptomyces fructofermentans]|uniref:hypothetical protein n=1 Tax=Streptomyces fructofermentans TaxID=152141 RepID=UPI0033E5B1E0
MPAFCAHCGGRLPGEARFCASCGQAVVATPPGPPPVAPPPLPASPPAATGAPEASGHVHAAAGLPPVPAQGPAPGPPAPWTGHLVREALARTLSGDWVTPARVAAPPTALLLLLALLVAGSAEGLGGGFADRFTAGLVLVLSAVGASPGLAVTDQDSLTPMVSAELSLLPLGATLLWAGALWCGALRERGRRAAGAGRASADGAVPLAVRTVLLTVLGVVLLAATAGGSVLQPTGGLSRHVTLTLTCSVWSAACWSLLLASGVLLPTLCGSPAPESALRRPEVRGWLRAARHAAVSLAVPVALAGVVVVVLLVSRNGAQALVPALLLAPNLGVTALGVGWGAPAELTVGGAFAGFRSSGGEVPGGTVALSLFEPQGLGAGLWASLLLGVAAVLLLGLRVRGEGGRAAAGRAAVCFVAGFLLSVLAAGAAAEMFLGADGAGFLSWELDLHGLRSDAGTAEAGLAFPAALFAAAVWAAVGAFGVPAAARRLGWTGAGGLPVRAAVLRRFLTRLVSAPAGPAFVPAAVPVDARPAGPGVDAVAGDGSPGALTVPDLPDLPDLPVHAVPAVPVAPAVSVAPAVLEAPAVPPVPSVPPVAGAGADAPADAVSGTGSVSGADSDVDPDAEPGSRCGAEGGSGPGPGPGAEADTESVDGAGADAEADSGSGADGDGDAESGAGSVAVPESGSVAVPGSEVGAESGADAESESESDSGSGADGSAVTGPEHGESSAQGTPAASEPASAAEPRTGVPADRTAPVPPAPGPAGAVRAAGADRLDTVTAPARPAAVPPQDGPVLLAAPPTEPRPGRRTPHWGAVIATVVASAVVAGGVTAGAMWLTSDRSGSKPHAARTASAAPAGSGTPAPAPSAVPAAPSGSPDVPSTGPSGPGASPTGTGVAPEDVPAEVERLLGENSPMRGRVQKAVTAAKHCWNGVGSVRDARDDLLVVATRRDDLVRRLDLLVPQAESDLLPALEALSRAWTASADADRDYAEWASRIVDDMTPDPLNGCPNHGAVGESQYAGAHDEAAGEAKEEFAGLWNDLAPRYGLTPVEVANL